MKKDILKIVGIIAFFSLLGYVITYPYEVKLDNKDMVLIEDMHGKKFNTLEDIINYPELKGKNLYIVTTNVINFSNAEKLNKLHKKYKNIEFIYIYYRNLVSNREIDHIRKWKSYLNEIQLKGIHLFGSEKLLQNLREKGKRKHKMVFPYALFVNTSGKVEDAPELYSTYKNALKKLDSRFLNTQKNDTIISK